MSELNCAQLRSLAVETDALNDCLDVLSEFVGGLSYLDLPESPSNPCDFIIQYSRLSVEKPFLQSHLHQLQHGGHCRW